MSISLGGLLLLLLGCMAQFMRPQFIVYLFVLSCQFGASAAISLGFLGGRPIQPVTFMLPFFMLYVLRMPSALQAINEAFFRDKSVILFSLFLVVAIMVSIFSPLLLAGSTEVFNVDDGGFFLEQFYFSASHIAQIVYLIGSFMCFLGVLGLSRTPGALHWFANATIALTVMNAVFAIVDLAAFYAGIADPLLVIKNARYAMMDQEMNGIRRVAGAFTETSQFSSFSVGLLAFNVCLFLARYRPKVTGFLSLLTALLIVISTSSSGYLGLSMLILVLAYLQANNLSKALLNRAVFFTGLVSLAVAVLLFVAFTDDVINVFETAILYKLDSGSGIERMSWNQQAWVNFYETYFIGVGLGGNRASSLLMVVLSNVGILGAVLFAGFLLMALMGRRAVFERDDCVISEAAKVAVIVMLAPSMMGATSFFLGLFFYIMMALGCSAKGVNVLKGEVKFA